MTRLLRWASDVPLVVWFSLCASHTAVAEDSWTTEPSTRLAAPRRLSEHTATCDEICGDVPCVFVTYGCYLHENVSANQPLVAFIAESALAGNVSKVFSFEAPFAGQVAKLADLAPGDSCKPGTVVVKVTEDFIDSKVVNKMTTPPPLPEMPEPHIQAELVQISSGAPCVFLHWQLKVGDNVTTGQPVALVLLLQDGHHLQPGVPEQMLVSDSAGIVLGLQDLSLGDQIDVKVDLVNVCKGSTASECTPIPPTGKVSSNASTSPGASGGTGTSSLAAGPGQLLLTNKQADRFKSWDVSVGDKVKSGAAIATLYDTTAGEDVSLTVPMACRIEALLDVTPGDQLTKDEVMAVILPATHLTTPAPTTGNGTTGGGNGTTGGGNGTTGGDNGTIGGNGTKEGGADEGGDTEGGAGKEEGGETEPQGAQGNGTEGAQSSSEGLDGEKGLSTESSAGNATTTTQKPKDSGNDNGDSNSSDSNDSALEDEEDDTASIIMMFAALAGLGFLALLAICLLIGVLTLLCTRSSSKGSGDGCCGEKDPLVGATTTRDFLAGADTIELNNTSRLSAPGRAKIIVKTGPKGIPVEVPVQLQDITGTHVLLERPLNIDVPAGAEVRQDGVP